jgi:hypothetical protein
MPSCGRQEPLRAAIGPLCAGLAVLAACSSPTKAGGTATVPTAPPSSTTTTTTDPWAVPATITPAYLDRVLAELDHIDGNAFRDARAHNAVTATYLADERAVRSSESEVQLQETDLGKYVKTNFAGVRAIPGDVSMSVIEILASPAPCIFASVTVDFSAVTPTPLKYPAWYVALVPRAPGSMNPTGWVLADDGFQVNGTTPDSKAACAD